MKSIKIKRWIKKEEKSVKKDDNQKSIKEEEAKIEFIKKK